MVSLQMMLTYTTDFEKLLQKSVTFSNDSVTITNKVLLAKTIASFLYACVFHNNPAWQKEGFHALRQIAKQHGAFPASIYTLYQKLGRQQPPVSFTVPACNIRTLTFDTACILFTLMKKHRIGPLIFEIARSEIEYTYQTPGEYASHIFAAAIATGYTGPIFLQGDHYQISKKRYEQNSEEELERIKSLITDSVAAGFYNIDIDASTLVDPQETNLVKQQAINASVTASLLRFIRSSFPTPIISVGAEIDHIGGKNSTKESLSAFMTTFQAESDASLPSISKISVQTGTTHGGTPTKEGSIESIALDFSVLKTLGKMCRETYHLGGVVQHGASTLPETLYNQFPKAHTLEIHLATGFQNIVFDHLPPELTKDINTFLTTNCAKEWEEGWNETQFFYKTRKKALGPFKKQLCFLSEKQKAPILQKLEEKLTTICQKLQIADTDSFTHHYV